MSSLERDQNRVPVSSGVTDDENLTPTGLRVDPVTKRLKVTGVLDSATIEDAGVVGASDEAMPIAGSDGTNYRFIKTDSDGHLQTDILSGDVGIKDISSVISTDNSSTSTLTGGSTFTGTGEDISSYASIKVSVYSDQDSAAEGLKLQFSSDGTNWDIDYDFDVTGGQAWAGEVGPEARYFRVVYVNGGTGQGVFRLQTIYYPVATEKLGVPVESVVESEDNATLTRAIIVARDPGGTYGNVQRTNGGNLKVAIEEFEGTSGQATMSNSFPVVIASDQSTITVDGTVTANLSATDNTVLDNIDSNTDYGSITGGGVEASALRVTLANDSTGLLSVDDNGGSLTIDNADISTIAGAVDGTEMQVDIVSSTPISVEKDGTALGNNQVTVDTTAGGVQVIAASAGRHGVDITNQGSTDCYIGTGSVSSSNGFLLGAGESIFLPTDSEIKAITSSDSTTVGYLSYA